jgi:hypothetical protein
LEKISDSSGNLASLEGFGVFLPKTDTLTDFIVFARVAVVALD